jgi:hypothetical protein
LSNILEGFWHIALAVQVVLIEVVSYWRSTAIKPSVQPSAAVVKHVSLHLEQGVLFLPTAGTETVLVHIGFLIQNK